MTKSPLRAAHFALGLAALSLASCKGESQRSDPPAAPKATSVEISSAGSDLAAPDAAPLRVAARRRHPEDLALLKRNLVTRGEARLWAAFGLGQACKADRLGISSALTAAFASWVAEAEPPSALELETLSRALGACASEDTERTLRSWLTPELAESLPGLGRAAALGLGAWADSRGHLEERTLTVLLDAAEREKDPLLLYPLGRLPSLSEALAARTLDVAGALVTQRELAGDRHMAILALGSAGPAATLPLSLLVLNRDFPSVERAVAVAALARLGGPGQRVLDETLAETLERGLPTQALDENWLVLNALTAALETPQAARKVLGQLGSAPLDELATPAARAQRRRMIALRCRAATLLAGENIAFPALIGCDPEHGWLQELAELAVVGRGRLIAKHGQRFERLARSDDPRVQQAALRLLASHAEYAATLELLVRALDSGAPGTRATALGIVAAHPERVQTSGKEPVPDPRIVAAIEKLLDPKSPAAPSETTAAALSALGALGVMTLKPLAEARCAGDDPALWQRASAALALLGNPGRECAGPTPPAEHPAPPAPAQAATAARVTLQSEVGALVLELDASAPLAVARLVERVKSGAYDGTRVSGVASGFAVAFGDRDGDGYEDEAVPPLADELGPNPWTALSVGVSSFSPGAASSLLMTAISASPQSTGNKVRLGSAKGPWHLLVPGDELTAWHVE